MAALRLRDRDAIMTREGLIFRVFGYAHPSDAYICDVEYAPAGIFRSNNPKAFRKKGQRVFYKFYEDEGWKFIKNNFPQHMIFLEALGNNIVGVKNNNIVKVRKPDVELEKLIIKEATDELVNALHDVLNFTTRHSGLSARSFGVFGSLLHRFHHPKFSDIDLIIYGKENLAKLCEVLKEFYIQRDSPLRNEFESGNAIEGKAWKFQNYTPKDFVWHQKRKLIYALFNDEKSGRIIKTEFEPVKEWKEISRKPFFGTKIVQKGWVKMFAKVTDDRGAPFIPSVYGVTPLRVLHGAKGAVEVTRVVSYMEEFRMQAQRDENVYVEGNLEEVTTPNGNFHQITLTYCPRYCEQVLKVVSA